MLSNVVRRVKRWLWRVLWWRKLVPERVVWRVMVGKNYSFQVPRPRAGELARSRPEGHKH